MTGFLRVAPDAPELRIPGRDSRLKVAWRLLRGDAVVCGVAFVWVGADIRLLGDGRPLLVTGVRALVGGGSGDAPALLIGSEDDS